MVIHFGQSGHYDYMDHGDIMRKRNFHYRYKRLEAYNDPTSGLYYSRLLLW